MLLCIVGIARFVVSILALETILREKTGLRELLSEPEKSHNGFLPVETVQIDDLVSDQLYLASMSQADFGVGYFALGHFVLEYGPQNDSRFQFQRSYLLKN